MLRKFSIRDWWRGWSAADLDSVLRKVAEHRGAGEMIAVTQRELRAHRAYEPFHVKREHPDPSAVNDYARQVSGDPERYVRRGDV